MKQGLNIIMSSSLALKFWFDKIINVDIIPHINKSFKLSSIREIVTGSVKTAVETIL